MVRTPEDMSAVDVLSVEHKTLCNERRDPVRALLMVTLARAKDTGKADSDPIPVQHVRVPALDES